MNEPSSTAFEESSADLFVYAGQRVNNALRLALRGNQRMPEMAHPMKQDAGFPQTRRFPTSLSRLDRMTGGGYGVTVVSGAPKVGKSMAAIGTAAEAASDGWRTIYLNAEMPIEQTCARFGRYFEAHPHTGQPLKTPVILDVIHPLNSVQLVDRPRRA